MPIVPKVPLARRILADVVAVEEVARRLRSEAEGLFCATCPCVCLGSLTIEALEVRLTAETPGNPPLISLMTRKGPGRRRQNLRTKRHERIGKGAGDRRRRVIALPAKGRSDSRVLPFARNAYFFGTVLVSTTISSNFV